MKRSEIRRWVQIPAVTYVRWLCTDVNPSCPDLWWKFLPVCIWARLRHQDSSSGNHECRISIKPKCVEIFNSGSKRWQTRNQINPLLLVPSFFLSDFLFLDHLSPHRSLHQNHLPLGGCVLVYSRNKKQNNLNHDGRVLWLLYPTDTTQHAAVSHTMSPNKLRRFKRRGHPEKKSHFNKDPPLPGQQPY